MTDALFVDCYPGDRRCDWARYIAAGPPWHGAIFKLSEGLYFECAEWALKQRKPFLASPRFGVDLFDGLYHFLALREDGAAQAEFAVAQCERAGGEQRGTLPLMIDVERGGQRDHNPSRAQVEDCTRAFAARYTALTGREATLYGGELLRGVGVTDLLGCGRSAIALYGATLPANVIARTGTDLAHLALWQYVGADERTAGPSGYPLEAPGCGPVDISAWVMAGGIDSVRATLPA